MARVIVPILFFVISVGLFFTYIDPAYKNMQELQALDARLDSALTKSREFQEARDALLAKYESFNINDIERLQTLLPDNVNNVDLTLGVDTIAKKHDIALTDFEFAEDFTPSGRSTPEGGAKPYGAATLSFLAEGTYPGFVNFLRDLEKSLRIVDIERIDINLARSRSTVATDDVYYYDVTLKSYWLQ